MLTVTGKVQSPAKIMDLVEIEAGMLAHPSVHITRQKTYTDKKLKSTVNANDRTVEGLDVIDRPCFTVQFHPEACPGPHDAENLFYRFREIVDIHLEDR